MSNYKRKMTASQVLDILAEDSTQSSMSEPECDVDDEDVSDLQEDANSGQEDSPRPRGLLLMSVSVGWKRKALTLLFISSQETLVYTLIGKTLT
jgi:hypothetical protein